MLEASVECRIGGRSACFVLPVKGSPEAAEALAEAVRGLEAAPEAVGIAMPCARMPEGGMPKCLIAGAAIVPAGTAAPSGEQDAVCMAPSFEALAAAAMLEAGGLRQGRGGWRPPSGAEMQFCAEEAMRMRKGAAAGA